MELVKNSAIATEEKEVSEEEEEEEVYEEDSVHNTVKDNRLGSQVSCM